jgi:hypothetical protein
MNPPGPLFWIIAGTVLLLLGGTGAAVVRAWRRRHTRSVPPPPPRALPPGRPVRTPIDFGRVVFAAGVCRYVHCRQPFVDVREVGAVPTPYCSTTHRDAAKDLRRALRCTNRLCPGQRESIKVPLCLGCEALIARSCDGKRRFADQDEATRNMDRLVKRGRAKPGDLHVYFCFNCERYHFGHPTTDPQTAAAVAVIAARRRQIGQSSVQRPFRPPPKMTFSLGDRLPPELVDRLARTSQDVAEEVLPDVTL